MQGLRGSQNILYVFITGNEICIGCACNSIEHNLRRQIHSILNLRQSGCWE